MVLSRATLRLLVIDYRSVFPDGFVTTSTARYARRRLVRIRTLASAHGTPWALTGLDFAVTASFVISWIMVIGRVDNCVAVLPFRERFAGHSADRGYRHSRRVDRRRPDAGHPRDGTRSPGRSGCREATSRTDTYSLSRSTSTRIPRGHDRAGTRHRASTDV